MLPVLQRAPARPDRSTSRRVWAILVALVYAACLYLLIRYAWAFWVHADALIQYPFEMDYGEGPLLHQARLIGRGEWPYQSIWEPPFIVGNYPPVFQAIFALGIKVTGALAFAPGRWISLMATLLSGLLIGLIVQRLARRPWASAMAALLWLSLKYVYAWGALARVDNLALFWSLLGLWLVIQFAGSRHVYWSVPFFLLAIYTRQSAIASAAAAYLWLLTIDLRRALTAMTAALLAGLTIFALLQWATAGEFFKHIVTYNQNEWTWDSTRHWLHTYWHQDNHALFTLLGAAGALAALWSWRRSGAAFLFLCFSWAVALTIGKIGSNVNYWLEAVAATAICTGALMGQTTAAASVKRAYWAPEALIPAVLLIQLLAWHHEPFTPSDWSFTPFPDTGWEQERTVDRIRRAPGPVISENMGLLALAGKEIEFQPFELTQVTRDGNWDEALIIGRVKRQDFAMIVLEFDAEHPESWGWRTSRFSPALLEAINRHYDKTAQVGQNRIYQPR